MTGAGLRVIVTALRRPPRANVDIALFFGAAAAFIVQSRLATLLGPPPEVVSDAFQALVIALPYLLLRLVDDFARVPAIRTRGHEAHPAPIAR